MSAKYCKHVKCSGMKDGKPCAVADDCPFFKWDIEKQKEMLYGESNERKESGKTSP